MKSELDEYAMKYLEAVTAMLIIKGNAAGNITEAMREEAARTVDSKMLLELTGILSGGPGLSPDEAAKQLHAVKARAHQIEAERAALAKATPGGSA